MPPPGRSGSGASRVHSTTPCGVGSPDAMPSENGFPSNGGEANARVPTAPMTVTDAAKEPPVLSSVLRLILWSQSPVMPMTPFLVGAVDPFVNGRHGARIPPRGEGPHQ